MNKKIAVLILMFVAAVFIAIPAISINRSIKLMKHGVQAEGTVTEKKVNKGLSSVTVSYNTAEGTQVTAKASKRNFVSTGEKVNLYYDPAAPQRIDFGDTISYNMRGVIVGGILFLVGSYYLLRFSYQDNSRKKLLRTGKKIAAEFVSVIRNENYRMGEKNPWVIKCRWIDSGNNQEYHFSSKDYTIDPAPYLNGRNHLDIFIDPDDPNKYYMDTSFMPEGNNTIG